MATVQEWLENLSKARSSSEQDSRMMQNLLHRVGFPKAVVVYGIVYPEGKGQPMSIHSMAEMMLPKKDRGDDRKKKGSFAKKVRVGSKYIYEPVPFDMCNPPFGCEKGDEVKVVNLHGCPKANTMGMCYVEKNGKFAGMVCTNSLKSRSKKRASGSWRNRARISRIR
jgi:hypothetical protein